MDGCVITWNKGAERMLKYTAEEIVGEKVVKVYSSLSEAREIMRRLRAERVEVIG